MNIDEPLVANASVNGRTPVPQKMDVNPARTITTQVPGKVTRATGAYSAMTRSRVLERPARPGEDVEHLAQADEMTPGQDGDHGSRHDDRLHRRAERPHDQGTARNDRNHLCNNHPPTVSHQRWRLD